MGLCGSKRHEKRDARAQSMSPLHYNSTCVTLECNASMVPLCAPSWQLHSSGTVEVMALPNGLRCDSSTAALSGTPTEDIVTHALINACVQDGTAVNKATARLRFAVVAIERRTSRCRAGRMGEEG